MTESFRVYDWNPLNLPPNALAAIGRVTACYAQTERILQQAIAGCAGVDFEYGLAITTHMPMPLRLSVLRSVAEIRIDDLDALDELDDLLERFETATQKRNSVAHNDWCRDPETNALFTMKTTSRARLEGDLLPMSVDHIESDALFIYQIGLDIYVFLQKHGLIPPMPDVPRPRHHKSKAARKMRRKSI